jgi:hypothetical protein
MFMTVATLKLTIEKLKRKLADPGDRDDKKWVTGRLKRCERRLARKERNLEQKQIAARVRWREPESVLPLL